MTAVPAAVKATELNTLSPVGYLCVHNDCFWIIREPFSRLPCLCKDPKTSQIFNKPFALAYSTLKSPSIKLKFIIANILSMLIN